MNTIDYVYRFDPANPSVKPPPPDAEAARRTLENGNRMFSQWMESCRTNVVSSGGPRYIVPCNGLEVGMIRSHGQMPTQAPFAVVVGCSDARVPTEMIFGQGFNDLFVIRVIGNVLGDVCMGSIDFAINALESVKCVVVLGHSGCGAVTAAVDSYLRPLRFWSKTTSHAVRPVLQRIFVSVREAAAGLKEVWGPNAKDMPGYREALIETAVCLNSAQSAFDLRSEVERAAKWEIEVLYGVHNIRTHQVMMPVDPNLVGLQDENVRLAYSPTNPREFGALAIQMAEILRPREGAARSAKVEPNGHAPLADGSPSADKSNS